MQSDSYYVGIDAGSVSLKVIVINQDKNIIYEAPYKRHMGRVEEEALLSDSGSSGEAGSGAHLGLCFNGKSRPEDQRTGRGFLRV